MRKIVLATMLTACLLFSVLTVHASEIVYVNCNLLNVRVSPNTSSEIITQLPRSSKLEILYTQPEWHNVKLEDGTTGFVAAQYVSNANFSQFGNSEIANKVASDAFNYIGYRYVYGTAGPSTFDCSGFTTYLYKQYGITLPRVSTDQGNAGTFVEKANLQPGDLVLFSNRSDRKINHVGVYVGNNEFIHASTSTRGVVKDNLGSDYYTRNYVTARRVV